MSMSGLQKRGLRVLLAAAGLLLLILIVIAVAGSKEVSSPSPSPVTQPSFTLNGADYPHAPILQDFTDRGWKLGYSVEQTGHYTQGEGPTNLVSTGYRLTSGENEISVYLDVDARRDGIEPGACKLRSLSLSGSNVESFCLDGNELTEINSSRMIELLGNPYKVDEKEQSVIYHYSRPEKGISEISFAFPNTLDTVGQIFVVFEEGT